MTLSLQNEESTSTMNLEGNIDICEGETVELTANYGDSYTWSTGDTSQTIFVSEPGEYTVTVYNSNCNTTYTSAPTTINEVSVDAPTWTSEIDTACLGDEIVIELNADDVNWYNPEGVLVSTQNPYIMPSLEDNIHLFASQIQSTPSNEILGESEQQGSNEYSSATYNGYLLFNALTDFTLESVEVFTDFEGERLIELKSELGLVVQDTLVFINEDATLELNWEIEAGNNYRLGTNTEVNNANFGNNNPWLKRNNQNTNYPYAIQNVVEITDSEWGQDYYYYFYNWNISWMGNSCESDDKLEVYIEAIECNSFIEELNYINNETINYFDLLGRPWDCSYEDLPEGCYIAKQGNKSIKIFKY